MEQYTPKTWAMAAVKGIVSQKERESAQQELWDHILDHKEALLAAGFSREEAERQAIASMGDPEITAKLLRKAHQPILTKLVQAARVCCICLAVILALTFFVSLIKRDDLLSNWFNGKPFAPDQEWFFGELPDDSILFRRVCEPNASLPIGDYTLRVHKAAVDQRDGWWEVHMLVEMEGKYLWQDCPFLPRDSRFLVEGQSFDFNHSAFWGHRHGGSYYSWFYLELPGEPHELTLELPCEDRTYTLRIDLKGGETYEKAR